MPTRQLLIVANRLPVTIDGDTVTKSSGGLVAALDGVTADDTAVAWVGWPGGEVPGHRRDSIRQKLADELNATPVFLSDVEIADYYEGFSNGSLWPLLHAMPTRFQYSDRWWKAYQSVNQKFADAVLQLAGDDDLVWVQDYQLMLLPAMLRAARPSLRIGFFLHTPFPSFDTFRFQPRRTELVTGLLGADLIGFHTFAYLRHYRDCVGRLLGIESDMMLIRAENRTARLAAFPIGINAPKTERELKNPGFNDAREKLAAAHAGCKLVVSVERLDYTKGIVHRLDAIDCYLQTHGADGVKFLFVSVPSREQVDQYKQLKEDVETRVGRLNGKYATVAHSPIHFIYGSVNYTELTALYSLAAACLVMPLIDGMNLVAKEFVAAQTDDNPGVLILSEFAGAAEELFNATIVNPYDTEAVAGAIHEALALPVDDRRRLMTPMKDRVTRFDARWWAGAFLDELKKADPRADQPQTDATPALDQLSAAIRDGREGRLFLDYDGTLRDIEADPAAAGPTPDLHVLLESLRNKPNVDVTIISGRPAKDLELFVGRYPFALVADGADHRPAGETAWQPTDRAVNYDWKDQILPVLKMYEASTPGSFIEQKRTSLVWHYRKADADFGDWKANELVAELSAVAANQPVIVRLGKKIVEATAAGVNKGAAVIRLTAGKNYDLIFAAGDDATDENMFRLVMPNLLTVKVGPGQTAAKYGVKTPADFRRFLASATKT